MNATLRGASCLVLGAGGFIGAHLCRALETAGARVHGFGHPAAFPEALPGAMSWTDGEFCDRAALQAVVANTDVVFHLLGGRLPEMSNRDPAADLQIAALSVQLLDLCRAARVDKIVFVSSGGTVYGVPRSVPIAEDAATDPISAYGIGKLAVEKYLSLYAHLHGLRSVVLRAANPYGPYQSPTRGQGVVSAMLARAVSGQPLEIWGDGQIIRDFVYAEDLVQAMLLAAVYDGPERVFNVGSGVGRSVLDVARAVSATLGRDIPFVRRPARRADVPASVLDISRVSRELGWRPEIEWDDGLRATLAWIQVQIGTQLKPELVRSVRNVY